MHPPQPKDTASIFLHEAAARAGRRRWHTPEPLIEELVKFLCAADERGGRAPAGSRPTHLCVWRDSLLNQELPVSGRSGWPVIQPGVADGSLNNRSPKGELDHSARFHATS
jgi:hypothetical protein